MEPGTNKREIKYLNYLIVKVTWLNIRVVSLKFTSY